MDKRLPVREINVQVLLERVAVLIDARRFSDRTQNPGNQLGNIEYPRQVGRFFF